jgi:hypothetical protein
MNLNGIMTLHVVWPLRASELIPFFISLALMVLHSHMVPKSLGFLILQDFCVHTVKT